MLELKKEIKTKRATTTHKILKDVNTIKSNFKRLPRTIL
jgi:hypothetical protein